MDLTKCSSATPVRRFQVMPLVAVGHSNVTISVSSLWTACLVLHQITVSAQVNGVPGISGGSPFLVGELMIANKERGQRSEVRAKSDRPIRSFYS